MNLAGIIEAHPATAVALRFAGDDLTYGELRRRCGALRRALEARGVHPGDRIALVIGATPDFPIAYFGCLAAGAVVVPLNPHSPSTEIGRELAAVGSGLVLFGSGGESVSSSGTGTPSVLVESLASRGQETCSVEELAAPLRGPLPTSADDSADEGFELEERDDDDPAVLLFTSGTAGSPKAAVLTHGSLRANIEQVELRVGLAATAVDVSILAVPPCHVLGLNAVLGVQLYSGGRLVMLERFEPQVLLDTVVAEGVTIVAGVPELFAALADYEGASGSELSTVRLACSGAAPLSEQVAARFEQKYGIEIWQGYGLTEASPTVTFPDLNAPRRLGSVGTALPGVEVRVVDVDGDDVEFGDPGEILVRGPNVFAGYYEDPVATRAALDRRGWLHTGDVAVMDDEGALTIVDRHKDLIIVSGFNVFPAEVEQVLESHGKVAEAAVVGVPDSNYGESVRAFVVPVMGGGVSGAPGEQAPPDEAELVEHCARHLARYKCPSTVTFVSELPHGLQGKVLRRAVQ